MKKLSLFLLLCASITTALYSMDNKLEDKQSEQTTPATNFGWEIVEQEDKNSDNTNDKNVEIKIEPKEPKSGWELEEHKC